MTKHRYKVGDHVTLMFQETHHVIAQRRIENGHICYKLDDGRVVNEKFLI